MAFRYSWGADVLVSPFGGAECHAKLSENFDPRSAISLRCGRQLGFSGACGASAPGPGDMNLLGRKRLIIEHHDRSKFFAFVVLGSSRPRVSTMRSLCARLPS